MALGEPAGSGKRAVHGRSTKASNLLQSDLVDSHDGLEKAKPERWMDFWLSEDDNVIEMPLYFTQLRISDHEPVRERVRRTGNYGALRPGIFEYNAPARTVVPLDLLRQYPRCPRRDGAGQPGEMSHYIQARLKVMIHGLSSRIEWEIASPHRKI